MALFSISFYRASFTNPGEIPKNPEWDLLSEDIEDNPTEMSILEKRKDGSLRICQHCQLRKPDRCHHCKQCDKSILKMDHHCN